MKFRTTVYALILAVTSLSLYAAPYQPDRDSLSPHPDPEWSRDAKFGMCFHEGKLTRPPRKQA